MTIKDRFTPPRLGTCYFPEHWPENGDESVWAEDAQRMVDLGLTVVRLGEFNWSRLEPRAGDLQFRWYDRAIDTLADAGLHLILCTPTATPPKWLVDQYDDILARDHHGMLRNFGSRRHYCFSSPSYAVESARITRLLGERYGQHPAVIGWQTDNEFGCHDTIRSYSTMARDAFRQWLEVRYQTIDALNTAWGTVFWSMEYGSFNEIELPNQTVTEANPSHVLDFYRFSSDQVVAFHKNQANILRELSPGRLITHNFMGFFTDLDAFAMRDHLDAAGWDSYPLGFLDMAPYPAADKARYRRQGHPDFAAFHHALYRTVGEGRAWVLEQQPGPVNWADHNPAPLPGMVRAWTWDAFGAGCDLVAYFRFRQAPFAQEQMHAGLYRPDSSDTPAAAEARQVAEEIDEDLRPLSAHVAILFDYESQWLFEAQPQGKSWSYMGMVMSWYTALRRMGLMVDVIGPHSDLDAYKLVLVPSQPMISDALLDSMAVAQATGTRFIFGPRTGSKTQTLTIPDGLAPGKLRTLIPLTVKEVESLPQDHSEHGTYGDMPVSASVWLEHVKTDLNPLVTLDDNALSPAGGLAYHHRGVTYLTAVPDADFLGRLLAAEASAAGLVPKPIHPDLRCYHLTGKTLWINFGPKPIDLPNGEPLGPADIRLLPHAPA